MFIFRTISQPRALSADIPAAWRGLFTKGSRACLDRLVAHFLRWYKVGFDKCSLWFPINFMMKSSLNVDSFDKSLLFSISFTMEGKLVHRKGWGMCRSPKSYNLSLDCPPCLVLFKMADKISMSQRALPKVTSQQYISSQRYIPNNVTLKKRQKPSAFCDRCQPSAGPR